MNIPVEALWSAAGGFIVWLVNYILSAKDKAFEDVKTDFKTLGQTVAANTVATAGLTVEVKHLNEQLNKVGELERDVAKLGEGYRELKRNINGSGAPSKA